MNCWYVLLNGVEIDRVWFQNQLDSEYVRSSLVTHDGFHHDIVVIKVESQTTVSATVLVNACIVAQQALACKQAIRSLAVAVTVAGGNRLCRQVQCGHRGY